MSIDIDILKSEKNSIEFDILEKPEPARSVVVTRWGTFDPKKNKKNLFRMHVKQAIKNCNLDRETPVSLKIIFYMPIPKGTSKKKKESMLNNELKHTRRPDFDNLQKFLTDTLKAIVFHDDSQVWDCHIQKRWSEVPKTNVVINYH